MNTNESFTESDFRNLTLTEIVNRNFRTAAVFEKYGLDFCCRGSKNLLDACEEKDINSFEVLNDLNNLFEVYPEPTVNYIEWEADFLVDYIVNTHHQYLRKMIPVISFHANKVAERHGSNHPETIEVAKHFEIIYKDLKQHMMKEEEILFPHIKYLVGALKSKSRIESPYFGTVKNPIRMMEQEHTAAGDEMASIRKLTNNYTIPVEACNTFKIFYQELEDFELDLHKHVHLENNILFPKAVKLEEESKRFTVSKN